MHPRLLAEDRDGLVLGGSPETLAASHPAWARDVGFFSPWRQENGDWLADREASAPVTICLAASSALDALWASDRAGGWTRDWSAVLAVRQWAGRGQMRRPWESPPGNLHVAFAWPEPSRALSPLVPMMAGAALAEGLEELGVPVRLKWPNDILWNGRKIGGVLVEERGGRVIVGFGLNVVQAPPPEALRADRAVDAACLADVSSFMSGEYAECGPLRLWSRLVDAGRRWYAREVAWGTPGEAARLSGTIGRRLAWLGERVRVAGGEADLPGAASARVLGLAPDGGLRLLLDDGEERTLYSGAILPY